MVHNNNSSPYNVESSKAQDSDTVVTTNNKDPPLEGVNSIKIDGIWTLKHEIVSSKLYEILIKTQIKGYTAVDLKNFYKRINI